MKLGFLNVAVLVLLSVRYSSNASFNPTDNHLISCGSTRNITLRGRIFVPDSRKSAVVLETDGDSVVSDARSPSPIYGSARIFTRSSSYRFAIKTRKRHWIRLHLFPINRAMASASFTVIAQDFVLLKNFKNYFNGSYVFREYSINAATDSLTLTFIPGEGSIAFVNAIEVVSIPDDVFPDQVVAPSSSKDMSRFAFETVYRINMGGPVITPENDTIGREWENDEKYLYIKSSALPVAVDPGEIKYTDSVTPEIAPNFVYATAESMANANVSEMMFNVTWNLNVDPVFDYLIRAHFCDIVSSSMNTLAFNFYINSDIAIPNLDLSSATGSLSTAYYRDFVVETSSLSESASSLTISVGPNSFTESDNAILNGLEVMKISNEEQSLAGSYSVRRSKIRISDRRIVIVSFCSASALLVLIAIVWGRKRASGEEEARGGAHQWLPPLFYSQSTTKAASAISTKTTITSGDVRRIFTFKEIDEATEKFDESRLLGVGGFGRVYGGTLDDGTAVAVKRGNPRSGQGLSEFRTEIEMLSNLRHRHLVSLIGYCDERSEMILVYEFMANGPLKNHLYGGDAPPLSWKQRLEVCIGAARGLHYLHTGAAAQGIIHRDVKTANVLLDENFVAKVADFGLSKSGPALDQTHVSTAVKGSFGYLDPEYFRRQQLTEKSDVYSFGVLLLEVLCARPALNPALPREQVNLAEWAMSKNAATVDRIMDESLIGNVTPASLKKFTETAAKCLSEYGSDRPAMGDVLWNLEYALQLDTMRAPSSVSSSTLENNSTLGIHGAQLISPENMTGGTIYAADEDDGGNSATTVFSQIVNPQGR